MCVFVTHPLRTGKKKHGRNLASRPAILRILSDSDNFEGAAVLLLQISKMLPDRVFVFKEFLCERLINNRYISGSGRVLFGNRTTFHNLRSGALKVAVADTQPR